MMEPEFAAESLLATATEAIAELEELRDERGLGEAWLIVAWARWLRCQAAQAEEAVLQAVVHARAAADDRGLAQAMILFLGAGLFGSLSVDEAIRRCESVVAEQPVLLRIEAAAQRALGALAAMQGRFDDGRAHLERDAELIEEGGLRLAFAAAAEIWGYVEMLAGDLPAAEVWIRRGLDRLPAEEKSASATLLARLAEVVYRQGRSDDAIRLTEECEEAAAADDVSVQVQWRAVRGKVLAAHRNVEEASHLASEAVDLSSRTDFLLLQGEALVDAAETMLLCNGAEEAARLLDGAVTCFERKGNLVSAADARDRRSSVGAKRPVRRKA
jgi:ATP/maltotriose-dependent transcriptional regulator MalT